MGRSTIAGLMLVALSGCQSIESHLMPAAEVPKAKLYSEQGHWIQVADQLQPGSQRLEANPALYRVLGEAYWRLGIQAMASYAALQPDAGELETLGRQVFELQEWLDENQAGRRTARESDDHAMGALGIGRDLSRGWQLDDL